MWRHKLQIRLLSLLETKLQTLNDEELTALRRRSSPSGGRTRNYSHLCQTSKILFLIFVVITKDIFVVLPGAKKKESIIIYIYIRGLFPLEGKHTGYIYSLEFYFERGVNLSLFYYQTLGSIYGGNKGPEQSEALKSTECTCDN